MWEFGRELRSFKDHAKNWVQVGRHGQDAGVNVEGVHGCEGSDGTSGI